jgi:hypothetical protein
MSVSTIYRVIYGLPEELRQLVKKNQLAANDWYRVRDLALGKSYTGTQLVGQNFEDGPNMVSADFSKERDALEADVSIAGAAKYILKRYGDDDANGR